MDLDEGPDGMEEELFETEEKKAASTRSRTRSRSRSRSESLSFALFHLDYLQTRPAPNWDTKGAAVPSALHVCGQLQKCADKASVVPLILELRVRVSLVSTHACSQLPSSMPLDGTSIRGSVNGPLGATFNHSSGFMLFVVTCSPSLSSSVQLGFKSFDYIIISSCLCHRKPL
jgi:hypothetical protein